MLDVAASSGAGSDAWQWLGGADSLTATLVALVVVAGLLRGLWRRTAGSRRVLRSAVNHLAVGVNEEYTRSLLGTPAYGHLVDGHGRLAWVTPFGHIGASFDNGSVTSFAFTRTDPGFKVRTDRASLERLSGRLGETKFNHFGQDDPPYGQLLEIGANRFRYLETYYFGNPGGYLYFTLSYSDSGSGTFSFPNDRQSNVIVRGHYSASDRPVEEIDDRALVHIRESSTPNTLIVSREPPDGPGDLASSAAIDLATVRLLPRPESRWLRLERRILGAWRRLRTG